MFATQWRFPAPFEISLVTVIPSLVIGSRGVGIEFGFIPTGMIVFVASSGRGLVSKAH